MPKETCKWIMYKCGGRWIADCGVRQGSKVRPKQKTCYCGKRIERVFSDELDPTEKAFREMITQFR